MSKSTAKQLGEHIAEMATSDRSRLVQRIQEVIIEDRKACGAAKDVQIAALREALTHIRDRKHWSSISPQECRDAHNNMRQEARAALEMSGGVL